MVFQEDIVYFWTSGRLLWLGSNPYDPSAFQALAATTGISPTVPDGGNAYLPWSQVLFLILGIFPFEVARVMWALVLSLALIGSLRNLMLLAPASPKYCRFIVLSTATLFYPLIDAYLRWGQPSVLLLFALTQFIRESLRGNHVTSALYLSLLSIKPHLAVFLFIERSIFFYRHRLKVPLLCLVWFPICGFILAFFFRPLIIHDYLQFTQNYEATLHFRLASVGHLIARHFGERSLGFLLYLPATFAFLWYQLRTKNEIFDWQLHYAFLLSLSIISAPYLWNPDFVILLPAYLLARRAWAAASVSVDAIWIALPTILTIGISQFGVEYRVIIPWGILFCLILVLLRTRYPGGFDQQTVSSKVTNSAMEL